MQANVESGCCVSNQWRHRRCICDRLSDSGYLTPEQCQSLCSNDPGCKGYVMWNDGHGHGCHLATTSSCPASCRGPYDKEHIEKINPNADCDGVGIAWVWNGGCLIKRNLLLNSTTSMANIKLLFGPKGISLFIKIFRLYCKNHAY